MRRVECDEMVALGEEGSDLGGGPVGLDRELQDPLRSAETEPDAVGGPCAYIGPPHRGP
jgi:hypothetical protein